MNFKDDSELEFNQKALPQPGTTLRKRLVKGVSAQAFGQGVQILVRLCEVPLFLSFWGAQRYGEWLMLAAIPAYLSMGDGGFATTSCREITMRVGTGDRRGASAVYQSTWALLLVLSLVLGSAAIVFSKFVPLNQWLKFTAMTSQETALVFLILVAHILLGFQGGLLNAGFWASGRYPQSMFFGALLQLLDFGGMSLAILMGGGPVQAATGYLLGRVLGTALMWGFQRNVCPWLSFGFKYARITELRRLLAPSFASLAFPLGTALNTQGLRLVIGLVLGPSAVAIFVPLRTLSNFAVQPRQVVNRLTEPEMAMAFGTGNKSLYQKLFLESVRISFWSCFVVAALLIPASRWIFPIWTTGQVSIHWPTFLLLLLAAVINSIWYAALMVSYSTNRHGLIAIYFLMIYGVTCIIFAFFGAHLIGHSGAAAALLFIESIMVFLVVRQAGKLADLPVRRLLANLSTPPIKELYSGLVYVFKKYLLDKRAVNI